MHALRLSASLVLYKPDLVTLERTLRALQNAAVVVKQHYPMQLSLTLVDNSDDSELHSKVSKWYEVICLAMPDWTLSLFRASGNLGYGKGNNLVISEVRSDYHLVINPDLFVEADALLRAVAFMENHQEVGLLSPAVFGEGGERHFMCKRHPTLLVMFLRSFSPSWLHSWLSFVVDKFEMRDCDFEKMIHRIEYPTGCFMFFRTAPLQDIGGFDPDFFLHYEDADIGRRMLEVARVVYVPQVRVVHQWARDTHRSLKAKLITVRSGFLYWYKWGGIFSSRSTIEGQDLQQPKQPAQAVQNSATLEKSTRQVLVTGAGGFIGQAVCAELPLRGHHVLGAIRKRNDALTVNGVQLVEMGDMDEHTDWSAALAGVNNVVHLAARVHMMNDDAIFPLEEFRRTNVALTLNLARQAAMAGVRRFIFISSVKVNGESTPFGQPFSADDVPHPTDPYGVSKLEAEQALLKLAEETGMELVIVRPTLVYGPGVRANFIQMMYWLRKGIPLPLKRLDNQRSMVSIGNLVDLIATCQWHPAAANQIFFASDGEDLTVSALLERTSVAMGRNARLFTLPIFLLSFMSRIFGKEAIFRRLCDPLQVDISKTRSLLNWSPPFSIDIALKKTSLWYLSQR